MFSRTHVFGRAIPNFKIAITFLVDGILKNGLQHVKEREKSSGVRSAHSGNALFRHNRDLKKFQIFEAPC